MERDSHLIDKLKNKYGVDLKGAFEEEIAKMEEKYDNDSETILAEGRYDLSMDI